MAQAEHTSGTYISTCHTFIAWLESALLYVRYTDTMQVNHHVNTGWMMYLIKLLLQILWQGSEIAALVLPKPWFTELDTDYERVAHEIRLNRSVTCRCFHALSPSTSPCKRYIYIYSGVGSHLCFNRERPYVQDIEKVKSFVTEHQATPSQIQLAKRATRSDVKLQLTCFLQSIPWIHPDN